MTWPLVSRYKVELKQQEIDHLKANIARLEDQVSELKAANGKAFELAQAEKDMRIAAEARAEDVPEETMTRSHRMFGSEIRLRASEARRDKAIKDGKLKG